MFFQRSDEIWKRSFVVCGLASLSNFSCLGAPEGLDKFGVERSVGFFGSVSLSASSRPLSPPLSFELLLPFLYTPFTGL